MTCVRALVPSVGVEFSAVDDIQSGIPFAGPEVSSTQRLPTDPIGSTVATLTNVVVDSVIRIEEDDGTLRETRTATGTTEAFTLSVYSAGSAKNDLVIKVRKATSAPKYQPFSTQASLSLTPQSIFIAQITDVIAA